MNELKELIEGQCLQVINNEMPFLITKVLRQHRTEFLIDGMKEALIEKQVRLLII
jgi:hypothetical protein